MTKISSKSAYPKKTPIVKDYFVGTDSENFGKTVSFGFEETAGLINKLNGTPILNYLFDTNPNIGVTVLTEGKFLSENAELGTSELTKLYVNKFNNYGENLSELYQFLKTNATDFYLKLRNSNNQNNAVYFNISSIDDLSDYFVFNIEIFKENEFLPALENLNIYFFDFELKATASGTSDPLKLDKGSYAGNATNLDNRITDLENTTFPDAVLKTGEITIVGNEASIAIGAFNWRLNQVEFLNPPLYSVTVIDATDGFYRTDILVGDNTGNYHLIQGTEDEVVAPEPSVPDGMIKLSSIPVFGATIGTSVPSTIGDNYVKKTEFSNVLLTGSGVINQLNLIDEKATVVFKGAITELKTISYDSIPYNGKRITLFNAQNTSVTIANSVNGFGVSFMFPNNQDYVLKPKQTIEFSFDITYFPYAHHRFIGEIRDQITDIENLSTELGNRYTKSEADTLLGAKLDTSAYNQHFKGVYVTLAALNTAHPTASVGDYAQVNEVGATDVVNYNWDDEDSLWVAGGGTGGAANTDALPEGSTNLYWTVARFLANLTYANVIAALGFTPENQSNKSDSYTASSSTTYASTKALVDGLATKQNAQYIYVAMSGQSNAVGYTLGTGGDFTVNNDVEVWNTSTSAWEVATSSNTHDPLQNGLNPTSNNIGWQFCKMMQKKTGKKVRYILSALGGISITEWETTGANQYVKLKTAIVNSGIPKLDYFLWHQGEGDVAMASATYETKLKTFYANLKAETFFGKNTIIVNGQLKKTGGQGFQNITYLRISQDPTNDIRLASSTDLVGWDLAHFTGAEVDIFAQRYFNTALGNERVVYENIASSYVPMNTIFGYDVKGLGRNGIDTTGSLLELGNSSVVGEGFLSFGRNGVKTNPVELQSYNGGVGYNPIIIQPLGGRALFGTRTDNTVDIIQANGTISASAATTANQVVIKSQLDAKIGGTLTSGYIPKATGSSTLGNSLIYESSGSVIVSSAKNSIGGTVQLDGNWTSGTVFGADGGDKFMLGKSVFLNGGATLGGANSAMNAFAPVGITGSYIKFGINSTEKMRLAPSGNLLINTTTDDGITDLQVNGEAKITALTLSTAPTTSPSTYDILTRNTITGVVEKLADVRKYKVYVAILNQVGTAAPTATVLENTLGGTVVWTRGGTGAYTATLTGAFISAKTTVLVSNGAINGKNSTAGRFSDNEVSLSTYGFSALEDTAIVDGTIEIRVYN